MNDTEVNIHVIRKLNDARYDSVNMIMLDCVLPLINNS